MERRTQQQQQHQQLFLRWKEARRRRPKPKEMEGGRGGPGEAKGREQQEKEEDFAKLIDAHTRADWPNPGRNGGRIALLPLNISEIRAAGCECREVLGFR